jgi:hypothetical protein
MMECAADSRSWSTGVVGAIGIDIAFATIALEARRMRSLSAV